MANPRDLCRRGVIWIGLERDQRGKVGIDHAEHSLHDALHPHRLFILEHPVQDGRHDLPREAILVLVILLYAKGS